MTMPWKTGEQCPNRGPALGHIRDTRKQPDGSCVFCGVGGYVTNVCRGYACIETVSGEYCEKCIEVRAHAAFSHKVEGHRNPVGNCPPCEAWL